MLLCTWMIFLLSSLFVYYHNKGSERVLHIHGTKKFQDKALSLHNEGFDFS